MKLNVFFSGPCAADEVYSASSALETNPDELGKCYRLRPNGHVPFYEVQEMCLASSTGGSFQSPFHRDSKEWAFLNNAIAYLVYSHDGLKIWDGIHNPRAKREKRWTYVDGSRVDSDYWDESNPWPFKEDPNYYRNTHGYYVDKANTNEYCLVWKYNNNALANVNTVDIGNSELVCKGIN